MLRAAAELICERGFGDTRIADVAKRAGVSSALVIYYFGTRDRLLVDALRYSEESFYEAAEKMLAEVPSLHERLSLLIRWTCVPEGNDEIPRRLGTVVRPVGAGVSARRDQGGPGRARRALAQDDRRRDQVGRARYRRSTSGCSRWSSPRCSTDCRSRWRWKTRRSTPTVAYDIAMQFAERELNMPPSKKRVNG